MMDKANPKRRNYPLRLDHPRFPRLGERLEAVLKRHSKRKLDVILEGTEIRVAELEKKEPV